MARDRTIRRYGREMLSEEHEQGYDEGYPERLRREEDLRELNEGPMESPRERRRRAQMEGLRRVMADTRKARTARVEPPPPHDGHAKDPRTAAVSPTPVEEDEEERRRRG